MNASLSKLEHFPKKGEIFGVKLKTIYAYDTIGTWREAIISPTNVSIVNNSNNHLSLYPYKLLGEKTPISQPIGESVTLLKYIGDGKCEEYYTSKIINICIPEETIQTIENTIEEKNNMEIAKAMNKVAFVDYLEFSEFYKNFLEHPLLINYTKPKKADFYEVDTIFKIEFSKNKGKDDSIIQAIGFLESDAKEGLKIDYQKLIELDTALAYTENALYTFQKRK